MSTTARTIRAWAVVIVVGAAASGLFALARLPSPVLFGSLLAGMAHALIARDELEMPGFAFRLGQALVGAVIGALVQLSTLTQLAGNWASVTLVPWARLSSAWPRAGCLPCTGTSHQPPERSRSSPEALLG